LGGKWKKEEQKRLKAPVAKKAALIEHQRQLQNFDRFNDGFVSAYLTEHHYQKGKELNKKLIADSPLEDFISVSNVEEF